MKKLADFKDEKGLEVAAALMEPLGKIAANSANVDAKGKTLFEFASALLKNSPEEVKAMLAILSDEPVDDFHYTAGTVFAGISAMLTDPDILELFGLQRQTAPLSTSASEITEGAEA